MCEGETGKALSLEPGQEEEECRTIEVMRGEGGDVQVFIAFLIVRT